MSDEYNGVMPIKQDGFVDIGQYWAEKKKLEPGVYKCHVLGLAQDSEDNNPYPTFVIKLGNGIVMSVAVEAVRLDERQKSVVRYGDGSIKEFFVTDEPKAEKVDRGDLF